MERDMEKHGIPGKKPPKSMLTDIPKLVSAYYTLKPDPSVPDHQVSFGTSGHRGSSFKQSFNERHILAITQAICEYRRSRGISGPLFIGKDTHALSEPALASALEVLAKNRVSVRIQPGRGYTPTPAVSHAILGYNRKRKKGLADGIVITPSHNPPQDGGFKYNPPEGGPADTDTTKLIEKRANEILQQNLKGVKRMDYGQALKASSTMEHDYITPYVEDLENIIDMEAIAGAKLNIGADPLGGAVIDFWDPIAEKYGFSIELVNPDVDPTFSFMTLDRDGEIRMDCSSPWAMAGLIELKNGFDVAFGNDTDGDRHGIVTKSGGLLNPNQFLAVSVWYLFQNRPNWKQDAAVGKTVVSSSMIDRVARHLGRRLCEVPVGFKWFVEGLLDGSFGFGGEESAGASFLRRDGTVWTTDKDGIILDLLACEIRAKTGKDPARIYGDIEEKLGKPIYERIDTPATRAQKEALKEITPDHVSAGSLAGEAISSRMNRAPGNDTPIGGIKVATESGWFAARPSGTEDVYKLYAESFKGKPHLEQIQEEARAIIAAYFERAGVG